MILSTRAWELTRLARSQVSSTETGVIFGNIFYDGAATADSHCVVLNDVHIDILDYINPAYCNEGQVSRARVASWWSLWTGADSSFDSPTVPEHVDRVRVGEQGQRQHEHRRSPRV